MHKKKLINLIENKFKEEFYAVPIGTIFSFASASPPPGAFILNGQIIANCRELFPDFWNWLISESTNNNIRVVTSSTFESELSSCGNCGAFVIDTTAGSVRLPSITTGFIQGTNSNIGNSEAAGLPNITGKFALSSNLGSTYSPSTQSGAFYTDSTVHTTLALGHANTANGYKVAIDASRSSSIYGNSNTVQPNSVHYSFCIQVYNSTSKLSTANASQISSELQGKAGINLENLTALGKNKMVDVAFELDYENSTKILLTNTIYQASKSGIITLLGRDDGSNTDDRKVFGIYCSPTNPYLEDQLLASTIATKFTYKTSINKWLFVPKNSYYAIQLSGSGATCDAYFIPFKNSK